MSLGILAIFVVGTGTAFYFASTRPSADVNTAGFPTGPTICTVDTINDDNSQLNYLAFSDGVPLADDWGRLGSETLEQRVVSIRGLTVASDSYGHFTAANHRYLPPDVTTQPLIKFGELHDGILYRFRKPSFKLPIEPTSTNSYPNGSYSNSQRINNFDLLLGVVATKSVPDFWVMGTPNTPGPTTSVDIPADDTHPTQMVTLGGYAFPTCLQPVPASVTVAFVAATSLGTQRIDISSTTVATHPEASVVAKSQVKVVTEEGQPVPGASVGWGRALDNKYPNANTVYYGTSETIIDTPLTSAVVLPTDSDGIATIYIRYQPEPTAAQPAPTLTAVAKIDGDSIDVTMKPVEVSLPDPVVTCIQTIAGADWQPLDADDKPQVLPPRTWSSTDSPTVALPKADKLDCTISQKNPTPNDVTTKFVLHIAKEMGVDMEASDQGATYGSDGTSIEWSGVNIEKNGEAKREAKGVQWIPTIFDVNQ